MKQMIHMKYQAFFTKATFNNIKLDRSAYRTSHLEKKNGHKCTVTRDFQQCGILTQAYAASFYA